MLDQDLYHQKLIGAVRSWILDVIIGFNFCPFAKKEFDRDRIHYELVDDNHLGEQLHALQREFERLDKHQNIATTVVIYPSGLESFFDYLDFLEMANDLLVEQGYEGVYQLASFHPDYCFEDCEQNDPANFTNRSPYPLIHIIREDSLEKVLAKYPDPESIPDRNVQVAREQGEATFQAILKRCIAQDSKSSD